MWSETAISGQKQAIFTRKQPENHRMTAFPKSAGNRHISAIPPNRHQYILYDIGVGGTIPNRHISAKPPFRHQYILYTL